jgi:transcriptional regulator with XRE-family HTH domain
MPNAETKIRRRRQLPGFPARLVQEINRSGISDAEIGRLTGIARNVLSGYKKGKTLPGVSELHALCRVLEVSPNQLVFGSELPFKSDPLQERLGLTSKDAAMAASMVFFSMLTLGERDAVLTIVHSLIEARHGKRMVEEADAVIKVLAAELRGVAPQIENMIEQSFPPSRIKDMERRLAQQLPQATSKPTRPKRQR